MHSMSFFHLDRQSLRNLKYHLAEDGCSEVQYGIAKQLLEGKTASGKRKLLPLYNINVLICYRFFKGEVADTESTDSERNQSEGIHWLLRAAQQGHLSALELLNECYDTGRGINERNVDEVRDCLHMRPGERSARKAAQELFASLSNGEEFVTVAQLEKRMRDIYKLHKKKKNRNLDGDEDAMEKTEDGDESDVKPNSMLHRRRSNYTTTSYSRQHNIMHSTSTISEANLVSAAINYSNGQLPLVNPTLTLSVPHPNTLNHIPCFHRPFFHPILFFSILYHRFISLIAALPGSKFANLQLLFVLIIYSLFSSNTLITSLPIILYYLSLIVMIISSFKMIKTKHEFIDFRMWSGLFLSYGDPNNLNHENSENQFLRNNLEPYLYFFIAFICNLIIQPNVIDVQWLPNSEITIISFLLTFSTMVAFMYTTSALRFPDYMILCSFGFNVLAKYPYEMDSVVTSTWRFLDLKVPAFSTFVIGNGIEFCLNCRALLYLMIPGLMIVLAYRNNWNGTYQYLIPHCVTLSWLQICIISSQSATMFGLVRAALGLSGLLLFLPLFGIVTLLIPIFATLELFSLTDSTVRISLAIVMAVIAVVASYLLAVSKRTGKYITILQIFACIIATVFLTFPYMTSNFETSHSEQSIYETLLNTKHTEQRVRDDLQGNNLNWETYYTFCHQPAWERINKVKTQLRCAHLDGALVRWEGVVSNFEISNMQNLRYSLIKTYLPKFIADRLICFYGEQNKFNCAENEQCDDIGSYVHELNGCNLDRWNTYEYEISVKMSSASILQKPPEVIISAAHIFGNFTQNLNTSDRIWFIGVLKNFLPSSPLNPNGDEPNIKQNFNNMRLGRKYPLLELNAIGCISCVDRNLKSVQLNDEMKVNARMRDLMRGVKYLLNVLFNPLVTFK